MSDSLFPSGPWTGFYNYRPGDRHRMDLQLTFANGNIARELLVDCDEARRRLVYAVVSERVKQHSASVQVHPDGDTRSRLIWIVDVLPHEIAPYIDAQMDQAALAMQKSLGGSAAWKAHFRI